MPEERKISKTKVNQAIKALGIEPGKDLQAVTIHLQELAVLEHRDHPDVPGATDTTPHTIG